MRYLHQNQGKNHLEQDRGVPRINLSTHSSGSKPLHAQRGVELHHMPNGYDLSTPTSSADHGHVAFLELSGICY